jgi:hypothetical protein
MNKFRQASLNLVVGIWAASLLCAQRAGWMEYVRGQFSTDPAIREADGKSMSMQEHARRDRRRYP